MAETTIYDPLRRKEVSRTPEEEVRQWFISILHSDMGVPMHMMRSEVGFTYGMSSKQYRADILIYGRDASPAVVVECKRPDVELSEKVLEQALRYDMVLTVKWIFITNGKKTFAARRNGNSFTFENKLPQYEEMII